MQPSLREQYTVLLAIALLKSCDVDMDMDMAAMVANTAFRSVKF